jgi:hypothetical protein
LYCPLCLHWVLAQPNRSMKWQRIINNEMPASPTSPRPNK